MPVPVPTGPWPQACDVALRSPPSPSGDLGRSVSGAGRMRGAVQCPGASGWRRCILQIGGPTGPGGTDWRSWEFDRAVGRKLLGFGGVHQARSGPGSREHTQAPGAAAATVSYGRERAAPKILSGAPDQPSEPVVLWPRPCHEDEDTCPVLSYQHLTRSSVFSGSRGHRGICVWR